MNKFTVALFTIGEPTDSVMDLLKNQQYVTGVWFEQHPNMELDRILVDMELDDEIDVEDEEKIIERLENLFYSTVEIIDAYEYYNDCVEW